MYLTSYRVSVQSLVPLFLATLLVHFGVDLFIEEALGQYIKFSVLFPDSVGTYKLKLFKRKLIKLIFDFPDVGLLQFGDCLFG